MNPRRLGISDGVWHAMGAVLVVALLGGGFLASRAVVAHSAPGQTVVKLWPAGQGRIEAVQGSLSMSCDFRDVFAVEHAPDLGGTPQPCAFTVAVGSPVTLSAVPDTPGEIGTLDDKTQAELPDFPVANAAFVRWTVAGCSGKGPCTITPDADPLWVGAIFTPLQLEVGINATGDESVSADTGGSLVCAPLDFGDRTCHGAFTADSSVVLQAHPASTTQTVNWGDGCVPSDSDSTKCTVSVNNLRTFAIVGFDQGPPTIPFLIATHVQLHVSGSGGGVISGDGLDCRTRCTIDRFYQDPVHITAIADHGSTFAGWQGVCATEPVCSFNAGSATLVEAIFDVPPPPRTVTTNTVTTNTVTTNTTTTTPAGTTTPTVTTTSFHGAVERVRLTRNAGRRLIALVLVADRPARATLQLSRRGRTILVRSIGLHAGRTPLQLRLPRSLKAGRYRLVVREAAGGLVRTFTASLSIGR
jgi:hypothetical protein